MDQPNQNPGRRARTTAFAALILLVHLGLLLGSSRQKSLITDEPYHLARGVAVLATGDFRMSVAHPPLINLITAAPVELLLHLQVPTRHPLWTNPKVHPADRKSAFAHLIVFDNPRHADLVRYGRLPVMFMSIILGLLIFREARRQLGEVPALAALALYAFSPTVLAHARLITTDLGCALFIFLFALALRRHLEGPSFKNLILCGFVFGLAQLTKYTSILLIPLLPIILLLVQRGTMAARIKKFLDPRGGRDWLLTGAGAWIVILLVGAFTIWAGYGFELHSFHHLEPPAPLAGLDHPALWLKQQLVRIMAAVPIPPRTYYYGLSMTLIDTSEHGKPLFFMGQVSQHGWWWYYPVMFVIKEPISLLALIGLTLSTRRPRLERNWSIITSAIILGFATFFMALNQKNIGIRHLLPLYPFLFLWIAKTFQSDGWRKWSAWVLLLWFGLNAFTSYPDYLVHFNRLAGGPDGGLRYAVVGEDWGQDLPALGRWMKDHQVKTITYEPYGNDDPAAYGINFKPLDCQDRPAGWYALHVVDLRRPTELPSPCLEPFNHEAPREILNHTIYLYYIPASKKSGAGP